VGVELTERWNKGFIKKDKEYILVLGPKERGAKFLEKKDLNSMIDVLHACLLLWEKNQRKNITELLEETGHINNNAFWQMAQSISEVLPSGDKEKQMLQGFLYGKESYQMEVSIMALPAWWQVATPHRDIREKRFSEAIFAADLGDVLGGNAPAEYMDPRLFFTRTYLTGGLKNLVRNVFSRLADGQGDPVIQLQTPFGGDKTHSLLCLYHLAKSFSEVDHLEQVKELASAFPKFKGAKVAAFVGTAADPIGGKTP